MRWKSPKGAISEAMEVRGAFLAYPHANGFADNGDSIVVGSCRDGVWSLRKVDLQTGSETTLCEHVQSELSDEALWFDVSLGSNKMYYGVGRRFYEIDLSDPGEARLIWAPSWDQPMLGLCCVNERGDRVAFIDRNDDGHLLVIIDPRTPNITRNVRLPASTVSKNSQISNPIAWNHHHFSPFNSDWIGFCNNAFSHRIPDRLWGWHPELAPHGKCFLDHRLGAQDCQIYTSHERWCYHDLSAITCALMTSPSPRFAGLWEVFMDEREPTQIFEHGRVCHCDVSRNGEFVVADTFGPHDGGRIDREIWENNISDVLLVQRQTGDFKPIARSHIGPRRANSPHFPAHPHHVHPIFHPNGDRVFYNDFDYTEGIGVVRAVEISGTNAVSSQFRDSRVAASAGQ